MAPTSNPAQSPPHDLSVVVCSIGKAQLARTVESVCASARLSGASVDVIVAWQGDGPPPSFASPVRTLDVFPVSLSHARNRGLVASDSPVVGFVDDDEVVDEGWVRSVLAAFDRDPAPAAAFGPVLPLDEGGIPYCHVDGREYRDFHHPSTPPWKVGTGGNMAFDRRALLGAGAFDLAFGAGTPSMSGEDTDIIVRLLRSRAGLSWSPGMVVYHPTKSAAQHMASRYPYAYGMAQVARRHRSAGLGARYLVVTAQSFDMGLRARDLRRCREALATFRGFVAGVTRPDPRQSPVRFLDRLPEELGNLVDASTVRPLPAARRARPHFRYCAGERLLHLYVEPSPALQRAPYRREAIRKATQLPGIPAVLGVVAERDALWVLEEQVRGTPPSRRHPERWYTRVAEWAVRMSGPPGPPLMTTDEWPALRRAVVEAVPTPLADQLETALEQVGELPSVHVHGSLQRGNVRLDGDGVSAVHWDRTQLRGMPGMDLVLLASTATGTRPDADVLSDLASGRDPGFAPVRRQLAELGVDDIILPAAILVMLAAWAHDEKVSLAAVGARPGPRFYADLLARLAPWDGDPGSTTGPGHRGSQQA